MKNGKKLIAGILIAAIALTTVAGIGQLFFRETAEPLYAAEPVWNNDGSYNTSAFRTSGKKGGRNNPFVILEIVPSYRQAQFGYLVGGSEPVDVSELSALDSSVEKAEIYNNLSYWFDKTATDVVFTGFYDETESYRDTHLIKETGTADRYFVYQIAPLGNGDYDLTKTVQAATWEGAAEGDKEYVYSFTENTEGTGQYKRVKKSYQESKAIAENTAQAAEYKYPAYFVLKEELDLLTMVEIKAAPENQKVYSACNWEFTNKELFKKYALGLIYEDEEYANREDTSSYQFDGWFYEAECVNRFNESAPVTEKVVLYAKWVPVYENAIKNGRKYSVTFDKNCSDTDTVTGFDFSMTVDKLVSGQKIAAPKGTPCRISADAEKYYVFKGWYKDSSCTSKVNFPCKITEDTVLYAGWEEHTYSEWEPSWTISFKDNAPSTAGVTDMPTGTVKVYRNNRTSSGQTALMDPVYSEPSRPGYVFGGWFWDSYCETRFDFEAPIPEEYYQSTLSLYALWVPEFSMPTYNVFFNENRPSDSSGELTGNTNVLKVEFGKSAYEAGYRYEDRMLSLEGNISAKLKAYNAKVVTISASELNNKSGDLIKRADLIVFSDPNMSGTGDAAINTVLANNYFTNYRNEDLFPTVSGKDYSDTTDSFADSDISFYASKRIFMKLAGVNTGVYGAVAPVVMDYSIYNEIMRYARTENTGYDPVLLDGTTGLELTGNEKLGINNNVYKLYLMTQQMNAVTLYNAYFKEDSSIKDQYRITDSGVFRAKLSSGWKESSYWNKYTLMPWNVISADDWEQYKRSEGKLTTGFDLVGVTIDTGIAGGSTYSTVRNRVMFYNRTDGLGIARTIRNTDAAGIPASGNDAIKTALGKEPPEGSGGVYTPADGIYYLINDRDVMLNYSSDISILELEPAEQTAQSGNTSTAYKNDTYWFWMISRYIPNFTGKYSVDRLSTPEFVGSIKDIKNNYDVIYVGGNKSEMFGEFMPDAADTAWFDKGTVKGDGSASNVIVIGEKAAEQAIPVPYWKWMESGHTVSVSQEPKEGYVAVEEHALNVYWDRTNETIRANTGIGIDKDLTFEFELKEYGDSFFVGLFNAWRFYSHRTGMTALTNRYAYLDSLNKNEFKYTYLTQSGDTETITLSGYMKSGQTNSTLEESEGASITWNYADLYIDTYYVHNTAGEWVYVDDKTTVVPSGTKIVLKEDAELKLVDMGKYAYAHTGSTVDSYSKNGNVGTVRTPTSTYYLCGPNSTYYKKTQGVLLAAYSGNDITNVKYKALMDYIGAGYPVIIGNELLTTDKAINTAVVDTSSYMYKFLKEILKNHSNLVFTERTSGADGGSLFREKLSNRNFTLDLLAAPPLYEDKKLNGRSDAQIYVNGRDISNKTLKYVFRIDSSSSAKYSLNYYVDINADGRFDKETEKLDSAEVARVQARGTDSSKYGNTDYYVKLTGSTNAASTKLSAGETYMLSVYAGGIVGALPWKLEITSNSNSDVAAEVQGLSAIKASEKARAYVLQILPDYNSTYREAVVFPDNSEVMAAEANGFKLKSVTGNEKHTNDTVLKTAQKFYDDIRGLNDFEVEFFKLTAEQFEDFVAERNAKIADESDPTTAETEYWEQVTSKHEIGFINNELVCRGRDYDNPDGYVIMEVNMLFIGAADCYGQTDLSDDACEEINKFISSGKATLFAHDTLSYYASSGYAANINRHFRELLKMDRYDVTKYGSAGWEYGNVYSQAGDWPFATGTDREVVLNNMLTSGLNGVSGVTVPLLQGFTNTCIAYKVGDTQTTTVTKVNTGQLNSYPFYIPDKMTVATTHSQYWQLDLEDDDVVVWYSLGKDDGSAPYGAKNDVRNNYYIYSVGNITYTGLGHRNRSGTNYGVTDEEAKLFVNTMVAAYRSVSSAAKPVVINPDASAYDENTVYLYINYDGTIADYDAISEDIPLKGDPEIIKTESGYFKRVYFNVSSRSIVFNKSMTVHFYPVKDDVVYYERPMELTVHRCDPETMEEVAELTSIQSFRYTYTDRFGNQVRMTMRGPSVRSGEIYYVDVPIEDSYYETLFEGDTDGVKFALDSNPSFSIRIDILMRYGKDQNRNNALSDCVNVVFIRRGLFNLD